MKGESSKKAGTQIAKYKLIIAGVYSIITLYDDSRIPSMISDTFNDLGYWAPCKGAFRTGLWERRASVTYHARYQ